MALRRPPLRSSIVSRKSAGVLHSPSPFMTCTNNVLSSISSHGSGCNSANYHETNINGVFQKHNRREVYLGRLVVAYDHIVPNARTVVSPDKCFLFGLVSYTKVTAEV
ncbi:hypothetical protein SNOG_04903 [Parastagonospora nodorum SN15]|uniref:Uncharacterized protein n=1 Tax=Phaeosphaeria nodorum (strain SN15 / ATCC MYA-4574 / FGSC 10173) TaxID=321614 RepID=Q0UTL1_PHANO|nr:hypothetical protein SNOG_04903 [Parastagonospora nodorum SN15]EAT87294.1 hypothetical protein SNOG_04903 [Parastagonospora nodorum SN15]